jgi:pSer/pThr/pTyr-binding forkhead associated (FHA) protein/Mg-chelatase subunit ChlD
MHPKLRLIFLALALLILLPGAFAAGQQNADPQINRSVAPNTSDITLARKENVNVTISQIIVENYPEVTAFVSVKDEMGYQLNSLLPEHFIVSEDGAEVGDITFANREMLDIPLALQFILDTSDSMGIQLTPERNSTPLAIAKAAVRNFVEQLEPEDRLGLITFDDVPRIQNELTTDRAEFLGNLKQQVTWGKTSLWDAVYLGVDQIAADTEESRRAIIVLTDGMDNLSTTAPSEVLNRYEELIKERNLGFSIFSIGLGYAEDIEADDLEQIAKHTGGSYLQSPDAEDLEQMYETILRQIQGEYILRWTSTSESAPGQMIDVSVGLNAVKSFNSGTYTYRSPGLTKALARALWPGLITIAIVIALLVIATIYKITRKAWLTVKITPLEGKDYPLGNRDLDIGSAEGCDIRLGGDAAILPQHAVIKETAQGYVLEAEEENAPIFHRGRQLTRKLLRSGDSFVLGNTELVFTERALRTDEESENTDTPAIGGAESVNSPQDAANDQADETYALLGISGPYSGRRFSVAAETVIGRQEGDLVLSEDGQLSRRHLRLFATPEGLAVEDLGSTNGTRVNGIPCEPGTPRNLVQGDVLAAGQGEYRLE